MELLILLLEKNGELVSREEVARRLWGTDVFVDVDHGINTAIRKVRSVLRDDPNKPRFVETVIGKGYRFAASVTRNGQTLEGMGVAETTPPVTSKVAPSLTMSSWSRRSLPRKTKLLLVPVLSISVAAGALWLGIIRARPTRVPAGVHSLAVLPLKNLSGDPGQEYLADGMTEELIGRLSGIHDLRVISRTSVMRFKDTQLSIPEISKMLGADAFVEGSVIREGNRIRVHAQLIRGASDEHLWSESYDRELVDILSLESEVAQSIAARVQVTVTGAERQQLTKVPSVAPEVYELYLKGRSALARGKEKSDINEAIRYFEQATIQDATFAPAYVGLASGHGLLGSILIGGASPEDERAKAINLAQKALQLDPELPEAYVVLADLHQSQWLWADAEAEYSHALVLNPNDAGAHAGLAGWLLCEGRTEEALNWARRARALDPLEVSGDLVGGTLYISRRYHESINEVRSALATSPEDVGLLWSLGFVLIGDNRPREAIPILEKASSISNRSPGVVGVLARAYALDGQDSKALELVNELQQRRQKQYVPAAAFVNAYLGLGETDEVFFWLEQGLKEKSNLMKWLKVDPMFDPLRGDPRFREMVRRVGLG